MSIPGGFGGDGKGRVRTESFGDRAGVGVVDDVDQVGQGGLNRAISC